MDDRQCTATSKQSGERCKRRVALGYTTCKIHGSATGRSRNAAERRVAIMEAKAMITGSFGYGLDRELSPSEAIKEELVRSASSVAWLSAKVGELPEDQITRGVTKIESKRDATGAESRSTLIESKPNAYYAMWVQQRRHFAQVAEIAHRMGIDERQTAVIEGAAQLGVLAIARVLERLELTEAQQLAASSVVPDVLRAISASTEPVGLPGKGDSR